MSASFVRRVATFARRGGDATTTTTTARVELGDAATATDDKTPTKKKESFWRLHKDELRELMPYLWPEGHPLLRVMFAASVAFLLASKASNVIAPIALKTAVDRISRGESGYLTPIVLYGTIRFGASFFSELKDQT